MKAEKYLTDHSRALGKTMFITTQKAKRALRIMELEVHLSFIHTTEPNEEGEKLIKQINEEIESLTN